MRAKITNNFLKKLKATGKGYDVNDPDLPRFALRVSTEFGLAADAPFGLRYNIDVENRVVSTHAPMWSPPMTMAEPDSKNTVQLSSAEANETERKGLRPRRFRERISRIIQGRSLESYPHYPNSRTPMKTELTGARQHCGQLRAKNAHEVFKGSSDFVEHAHFQPPKDHLLNSIERVTHDPALPSIRARLRSTAPCTEECRRHSPEFLAFPMPIPDKICISLRLNKLAKTGSPRLRPESYGKSPL